MSKKTNVNSCTFFVRKGEIFMTKKKMKFHDNSLTRLLLYLVLPIMCGMFLKCAVDHPRAPLPSKGVL